MVELSGLAAHKKPRIWAWQPSKSLDYKFLFALLVTSFIFIDHFSSKPASFDLARLYVFISTLCFLTRCGLQLSSVKEYNQW